MVVCSARKKELPGFQKKQTQETPDGVVTSTTMHCGADFLDLIYSPWPDGPFFLGFPSPPWTVPMVEKILHRKLCSVTYICQHTDAYTG